MKQWITYIDAYGFELNHKLPKRCVSECSASGSVDDAVEYWLKELNFNAPVEGTKSYLKEYGAWEGDELARP